MDQLSMRLGSGHAAEGLHRPGRPVATLLLVCLALLVVVVDVTVLHVAAPTIADDLGASPDQLLWIVDAYPLVVAPLLLATGVLGDRFGHRRMLIAGLIAFAACSLAAACSVSPLMLAVVRGLLGVAAAMIMPATMALLRHAYPDRAKRLRAVGIWSAVSAGGAAVGPLVGGALVEAAGWNAVFLVNVPHCLVVAALAWWLIPRSRRRGEGRIDPLSVALSVVAILALVAAVKGAAHDGPGRLAVGLALAAVAAGVWFVRRQRDLTVLGEAPMLDLSLFRSAPFSVAVSVVLLAMFAIVGLELLLAQYLQLVLGLTPLEAGLRLAAISAATVLGALSAAVITRRLGVGLATVLALGLASIALVPLLSLGDREQVWLTIGCLGVVGFCLEIAFVAANDTIISNVPVARAGQAAGIEETAYDLGGGLGIAVLGSIGAAVYTATFSATWLSPAQHDVAAASISEARRLAAHSTGALHADVVDAANLAFLGGLHAAIAAAVGVLAAAAVLGACVHLRATARGRDGVQRAHVIH